MVGNIQITFSRDKAFVSYYNQKIDAIVYKLLLELL